MFNKFWGFFLSIHSIGLLAGGIYKLQCLCVCLFVCPPLLWDVLVIISFFNDEQMMVMMILMMMIIIIIVMETMTTTTTMTITKKNINNPAYRRHWISQREQIEAPIQKIIKKLSCVICHVSCFMFQVSCGKCHVLCVNCHMSPVTWPQLYAASAAIKVSSGLVMQLRVVW